MGRAYIIEKKQTDRQRDRETERHRETESVKLAM